MNRNNLKAYQNRAIDFMVQKKSCALFLDMGLGKTVIALTAISDMLESGDVDKVLIVAPIRVANSVWRQEAKKWEHTEHLRISVCTGKPADRRSGFNRDADIYIINPENLKWMITEFGWKWKHVVIDESSMFKSHKTQRFKIFRHLKTKGFIKSCVLLTGTPRPNGLQDIWSQMFLVDGGERLGKTWTGFMAEYFAVNYPVMYFNTPRADSEDKIYNLISDVCMRLSAEEYIQLPDKTTTTEIVEMPNAAKDLYQEIKESFITTVNDVPIQAPENLSKMNKLLQLCNGFLYDETGKAHQIHLEKVKRIKEILEVYPEEHFLIVYQYKHDLVVLKEHIPGVVKCVDNDEIEAWNAGEIQYMAISPKSLSHGVNLQFGGHNIIWMGLTWSLEHYEQLNSRLHRQGQEHPVNVIHVITDYLDKQILKALSRKHTGQQKFFDFLKNLMMSGD